MGRKGFEQRLQHQLTYHHPVAVCKFQNRHGNHGKTIIHAIYQSSKSTNVINHTPILAAASQVIFSLSLSGVDSFSTLEPFIKFKSSMQLVVCHFVDEKQKLFSSSSTRVEAASSLERPDRP
ncbi:hypothetical protein Tsp_03943 [Trichinella spiralis]|uniref:hypothetical protein n=1 Tax=Trichinella spiralis TaxID=6334 RepID=UPI0001EFC8F2|nr:hypothetical protein Tsp_03943 [Trichinella spiralis]